MSFDHLFLQLLGLGFAYTFVHPDNNRSSRSFLSLLAARVVLYGNVYCVVYSGCGTDRYYVGTDWQPKKLDVEVEVPLTLDLESLRSTGMQVRWPSAPE